MRLWQNLSTVPTVGLPAAEEGWVKYHNIILLKGNQPLRTYQKHPQALQCAKYSTSTCSAQLSRAQYRRAGDTPLSAALIRGLQVTYHPLGNSN